MDRTFHSLPLEGYRPRLLRPVAQTIPRASAQVDGDDWGELDVDDVQARLVDADDFAIVQLDARFCSQGRIEGGRVHVTGTGLRNIALDGSYLTPVKGEIRTGAGAYELPPSILEGEHRLVWSYAWNPPVDPATGEPRSDGVALARPRLEGEFRAIEGGIAALPEEVNLRDLAAAGLDGEDVQVEFSREVELPMGLSTLIVEGPWPGTLEVSLDGTVLVPLDSTPIYRFKIDPFLGREAPLVVRFTGSPRRVTSIRLVR